jgi:hypothetical protein
LIFTRCASIDPLEWKLKSKAANPGGQIDASASLEFLVRSSTIRATDSAGSS